MWRAATALLVACAATLPAQRTETLRAGVNRHLSPATSPILSLLVPGAGQFVQGKDRFVVYITIEAIYWWKYSKDANERRQAAGDYKDLARRVARAHFFPNTGDGDWTYYESMRDYKNSGDFSKAEGSLVPESNVATFNGQLWQLIRRTTPGCSDESLTCDAGLDRYRRFAIPAERQWSWENAGLQRDLFIRATELRNDANHAMVQDLSIITFNHLVSMVDAFSVLRLEAHVDNRGRTSVGANIRW